MTKKILIFDGDCGFCTSSAKWLKSKSRKFSIQQWQTITDLAEFELTINDVQTAAYLVEDQVIIGRGSDAISKCLTMCHFPFNLAGYVLLMPGIRQLARPIYRSIAKNRHVMPGSSDSCKL